MQLLSPAFATYLEEPYAKVLYDRGYIIVHGFDARSIQFYHYFPYPPFNDFRLVFETHEDERVEAVFFDRTRFNETTSFAIDSRKGSEDSLDPNDNCLRRADKKLKDLMYGCGGRTNLRPLTDEERAEVQQYKKEQQGRSFATPEKETALSRIELFELLWFTATALFQQSQRNRLRWSIPKVG